MNSAELRVSPENIATIKRYAQAFLDFWDGNPSLAQRINDRIFMARCGTLYNRVAEFLEKEKRGNAVSYQEYLDLGAECRAVLETLDHNNPIFQE